MCNIKEEANWLKPIAFIIVKVKKISSNGGCNAKKLEKDMLLVSYKEFSRISNRIKKLT